MSKDVTRLFEQFQPEKYQLELHPNPETMQFSGTVTIDGKKVGRPSKRLTFHQNGLKIHSASITKHDKKGDLEVTITRINNQATYDEVRLHSDSLVYPGAYTITMEFTGEITRPMNGIYPCFFNDDGQEKKLIATQFESHHAREAFPCIDEPEAKAVFDLTLVTPPSKAVISNTPVKEQSIKNDSQITVFETTPKMSTYLLAFVFGELEHLEATTKDNVLVRTYATPANVAYTKFALDCAVRTLEFYNEYFAIPYPLPKCDFIALPDFASGAMENWGCITFREQALLVDPKNTSLHLTQYVANVVAHELTHQWFGNLVTMRWWTDLWLNESFASWMSWLAVDSLFPDWKVWTQFIVDEQGLALKLDALENTHPIEVEVHHPDEIRTIFDAISYEKGASVLLMLHNYLGGNDFRDGLRLYLKQHAYGNTDTVDLWNALGEVSKKPVAEFMGAWTATSGYPIVKANLAVDNPRLSQERFYLNPEATKEATRWPIPLLASEDLAMTTLEKTEQPLKLRSVPGEIVLNHNRTSFFRTMYDPDHLAHLAKVVSTGKLNELDRLGLLSDTFEAAKAGYGQTVDAFKLLEAYSNEDSAVVWDIISGAINSVRVVMNDDTIRGGLKPFVRGLVSKQRERLGWEEQDKDSHFDRLLRPTILGLASFGEEPSVVSEAQKRFEAMKLPEDVHPDVRGVVYGTMARLGDANVFDKMVAMHNASTNSEERVTLAGALTGFKQPELITRALDMITSDNVRLQDVSYWIAYSFMNRHGRQLSWQWIQANWDWLEDNLGKDLSFFRLPNYASRGFSDAAFLPEFKEFFAAHMSPAFERPVKQAIETIQWQAAWRTRDLTKLQDYFKS
jgi:puromycin-sensitive aminopeptidase